MVGGVFRMHLYRTTDVAQTAISTRKGHVKVYPDNLLPGFGVSPSFYVFINDEIASA